MDIDPIKSLGPIPPSIDASEAISKRLAHVSDLVDVIYKGGRDYKPRTAMQRLPRHMRRRAMSHNIRRLPRKRREFGKSATTQSNHRKKPPSRVKRRRPNNLRKEYMKRSAKTSWLFTHIFHAKRFEMINLWSYKVPLRSYQRGVRPFLRDARDHTVLFDDSYYRLLQFIFKTSDELNKFMEKLNGLESEDYSRFNAQDLHTSGYSVIRVSSKELAMSVHPLFSTKPLELLNFLGFNAKEVDQDVLRSKAKEFGFLCQQPVSLYQDDSVNVFNITNLYAKFSFYGKTSLPSINNLISLVSDTELDKLGVISYKCHHVSWNSLVSSNAINDLPDGSCFSLLIEDPRLGPSKRLRRKCTPTGNTFNGNLGYSNTLFDRKEVEKYISKYQNTSWLNKSNATHLTKPTTCDYKIPLMIVIRNFGECPKVEMYMPFLSASSMLSFLYRSGVRVGSLSDRYILAVELNDCSYPWYWMPLTVPKASYRWKRYKKMKEQPETNSKWNKLSSFTYLLSNFTTLTALKLMVMNKLNGKLNNAPSNVIVPIRILVFGKGRITDNDLIFKIKKIDKTVRLKESYEETSMNADLLMDFTTEGTLDIGKLFGPPASKKPRFFIPMQELSSPIGRLTYSRHSLFHGKTEAFGFVELKSVSDITKSDGWVALKNISSTKYVRARLTIAI